MVPERDKALKAPKRLASAHVRTQWSTNKHHHKDRYQQVESGDMSSPHGSDGEERKRSANGDGAPNPIPELASLGLSPQVIATLEGLPPAHLQAVFDKVRTKKPVDASSNAVLCAQLAEIPGLETRRKPRTAAARVMTPPLNWGEADTRSAKGAMILLHRGTFTGTRDRIVSLVGGPGTGKSYSVNQITSLEHASRLMKWATTTATVAVTFNDTMNLDRGKDANLWEEVVLRLLFSHYYSDTSLSFIDFRETLAQWIDTACCCSKTVTKVLHCIQKDVDDAGKTTLLLAVDELIRVDATGSNHSVKLLSKLASVMDSMNKIRTRSMMLVVTSLSAAPLDAIRPAASDSGRYIHGVALPLLYGPSAVDLVARAAAHPNKPSDTLRPLIVKLVAMCGGHPRTLECACMALREVLTNGDNSRHISLGSVLVLAARRLCDKYAHIVKLTVPTVLAVWSGDRVLGGDTLVSPASGGNVGAPTETVADMVERGVLFATISNDGVWYEPRLSVVQLLAWAAPQAMYAGDSTRVAAVRKAVAQIILDSVAPALFDKTLEHVIRGALQVRMVLLSGAAPTPVTWRTLLNVAPRQQEDKKKGPYDEALARCLLLPGRGDLNNAPVTYETKERDEEGMWAVGDPLVERLAPETRHNKWLHPPPSKTQAYDLVMRCTEVVGEGKDCVEEPCVAFAQVKGLNGDTADAWRKGHKSKVQKSCNHCRQNHEGKMVFIAAANMDTPAPKRKVKTTLTTEAASAFIVLDREGCRRLMGTPLYTAFDTADSLNQATKAGAGSGAGAGGGSA